MKKLIIILFLFSTTFAATKKTLKERLHECQTSKTYIDTIYLSIEPQTPKKAAKISKQVEKTKRLELKELTEREKIAASKELKQAKKETKQNRSNNKKETKTNFVFKFFSTIKHFIWNMSISQALGGAGYSSLLLLIGEKFKIFTKLGIFKKQE